MQAYVLHADMHTIEKQGIAWVRIIDNRIDKISMIRTLIDCEAHSQTETSTVFYDHGGHLQFVETPVSEQRTIVDARGSLNVSVSSALCKKM